MAALKCGKASLAATAVETANKLLARVQQVRSWRLLQVEWTVESEEPTPTLRLERRVMHADMIDGLDSA